MPEIFISTEDNRHQFKEAIIKYLNGTLNISETKHAMRLACTYRTEEIDAKRFAKNIPLFNNPTDTNLDSDIIKILTHLNRPTQKKYYTDLGINSLYDLITRQKEKDLDYLIEMIDDCNPSVSWFNYIYRPTLAVIGLLSFSYLQPQYFWIAIDWVTDMIPVIYHWLYHSIVQLHNLPVIGMGMQITFLLYYLNSTFEHGLDPSEERTRTLLFRAISLALNFLAHLITYSAAGTLSWLPASIFIASSLVGIVESIYSYWVQKPLDAIPTNMSTVHSKAWEIRHQYHLARNRNFFLIRLIYAISISSLVLAWTVLTPSVILTMAYMLSMGLAFLIKDYCITLIKHRSANAEQIAVLGIYNSPHFNPARKIEADKEEFRQYATEVFKKFDDRTDKQSALYSQMFVLMKRDPFVLDECKTAFDSCVQVCDTLTPSPARNLSLFTPMRATHLNFDAEENIEPGQHGTTSSNRRHNTSTS